jgi:hypothetical protein
MELRDLDQGMQAASSFYVELFQQAILLKVEHYL